MTRLCLIVLATCFSAIGCLYAQSPLRLELNGQRYFLNPLETSMPINGVLRVTVDRKKEDSFTLYEIQFENTGRDTLRLTNLVPLGPDSQVVHITGRGQHPLSRTHLFVPGRMPVNIICPDNAWELGFSSIPLGDGRSRVSLTRRDHTSIRQGLRRRFETLLFPGGQVRYRLWATDIRGDWQDGLSLVCQERKLFDTSHFDGHLYQRPDLQWIRSAYVAHLFMAWDRRYYDGHTKRYLIPDFIRKGKRLYGGDDIVGLWPTWPTLGMDPRNQFDMYHDLPGGSDGLKALADTMRDLGTKFFVAYNPWDESTRKTDHLDGLTRLIATSTADGVVLDTRGSSSRELQEAADKARPGVVMYSEGMAVPADMQNIVAGRVHNALYYPPLLNLNKLIQPAFSIFRVVELYKEPVRREFSTAFFNGYGTEINVFAPGNPEWLDEQYAYLGRTSRILREHSSIFTRGRLTPVLPTTTDSIWVNRWLGNEKTLYTVFSILPGGYRGSLFEVQPRPMTHFVDLWHHKEVEPIQDKGRWLVEAETDAFHNKWLGTNNEGAVDAIAQLPILIRALLRDDRMLIESSAGDSLSVWKGAPAYNKDPLRLASGSHQISISHQLGGYEGKLVIQLFRASELLDEVIVPIVPGLPRKINLPSLTSPVNRSSEGMVQVPAGRFHWRTTHGDAFIPYPAHPADSIVDMPSFRIDKYPVTNRQYEVFLKASAYQPTDTVNFLKHWQHRRVPAGMEEFPVVFISIEDAQAYAAWAGKRLPSELEWQYAAQTSARNEWPWKQTRPVTRKETRVTETLTVFELEGIDSIYCNTGNGRPEAVGSRPRGANPLGLEDLVGSVWQLTSDIYQTGSYQYVVLKGGSYFKPASSWWYVQGGPRELHYRQQLLRVSAGFERNATVGFRCVR